MHKHRKNTLKTDEYNESEFLIKVLQDLRRFDPEQWPNNKTKDTNDPEFEFIFNKRVWFPVFLSPWHRSSIRRSPYIMMAFQPGTMFDFNKTEKKEFYERMRTSIHSRIDCFYENKRPYYLTPLSSGKNICQYIGYDETAHDSNHVFPKIV